MKVDPVCKYHINQHVDRSKARFSSHEVSLQASTNCPKSLLTDHESTCQDRSIISGFCWDNIRWRGCFVLCDVRRDCLEGVESTESRFGGSQITSSKMMSCFVLHAKRSRQPLRNLRKFFLSQRDARLASGIPTRVLESRSYTHLIFKSVPYRESGRSTPAVVRSSFCGGYWGTLLHSNLWSHVSLSFVSAVFATRMKEEMAPVLIQRYSTTSDRTGVVQTGGSDEFSDLGL
ncbi:hypothetical protein J6590_051378 [Homalodisca vitripennis]|nr:hypothetical protein J6590_051378 [Homalodisca vitripennis]